MKAHVIDEVSRKVLAVLNSPEEASQWIQDHGDTKRRVNGEYGIDWPCSNENTMETLPMYGGKQGYGTFRTPASIAEMISWCSTHSHIWVRSLTKDARQVKVNGKVRTWKRDQNRVEVPVKYGLYEYATLDASDIDRILIPVKETE